MGGNLNIPSEARIKVKESIWSPVNMKRKIKLSKCFSAIRQANMKGNSVFDSVKVD